MTGTLFRTAHESTPQRFVSTIESTPFGSSCSRHAIANLIMFHSLERDHSSTLFIYKY